MLEDDFSDVLRKAMRGNSLTPQQAASMASLDPADVTKLLNGSWYEPSLRILAKTLSLHDDALAALPRYCPPSYHHPAITRIEMPFGETSVNAWLLDTAKGKLLIDAGVDASSLTKALADICNPAQINHVIITHNHRDHVGGLEIFNNPNTKIHGPGPGQPWLQLNVGESLDCGTLLITAHNLSGHATPALGLEIHGLNVPVFATGDALFAGSIGGCKNRETYILALKNLSSALANLQPQTLLLPGHGPPTRLLEETHSNPFLAMHKLTKQSGMRHA